MADPPLNILHSQLSVCIFVKSQSLAQSLSHPLSPDRYITTKFNDQDEFFDFIHNQKQHIDCLVLEEDRRLLPIFNWLYEKGIILPVVIVTINHEPNNPQSLTELPLFTDRNNADMVTYFYHPAEIHLSVVQMDDIEQSIEQAITKFLNLSPNYILRRQIDSVPSESDISSENFALQQRERLAEKLKERLGYLGVYYKRNSRNFYRYLSRTDKQKFLETLTEDYQQIILNYFYPDQSTNQLIDNFVNTVFFADLPVAQVVEIHMELMEQFSKQLKLEGRNEDILLDYRLTLIDIIAHLCEMYRRSIPRES
jgi:circadian clock protein KaiA